MSWPRHALRCWSTTNGSSGCPGSAGVDRAIASEMCRRLDGLPLAIELAAAQLAHLGIADLASRLDRRLDLLVGGRSWDGRSPTLQSIMEWSAHRCRPSSPLGCFGGSRTRPWSRYHSVRYRLLETVRMFAAQQLATSGATHEARCHHRD